jgi:acyl-CoA synthetase (AMP-forming)/AMP-acid ligase II
VPGVRDCAVYGIPHKEFGETLCAHIEPEPDAVLDEATIHSFLRERLADFKVPRVIRFESRGRGNPGASDLAVTPCSSQRQALDPAFAGRRGPTQPDRMMLQPAAAPWT